MDLLKDWRWLKKYNINTSTILTVFVVKTKPTVPHSKPIPCWEVSFCQHNPQKIDRKAGGYKGHVPEFTGVWYSNNGDITMKCKQKIRSTF